VRPTFAGAFTGATVLLAAVACGPVNSANFLSRFYLSVRASDASITRLAINLPGARRTFGTNQQFRWG
jgi:hypothetical protein